MKQIILVVLSCISLSGGLAIAQTVAVIGINDVQIESPSGATDLSKQLATELKNKLLSTRKFKVLDRAQMSKILSDRRLTLETVTDIENQEVQYDVPGLDYVFSAKVVGFTGDSAVAETELRSTSYPLSSVAIQASMRGQSDGDNNSGRISALADAVVTELVASIFPVRVMHVDENGLVTLNYGKGYLHTGETLNVFAPVDAPNNGAVEPGEVKGPPVATLQIVDTNIKFSTAKITSGNEDLKPGFKSRPTRH